MKDEDDILKELMSGTGGNYVMDDGFTRRVMDSLPRARNRMTSARRRTALILAATAIGCSVSAILSAPALAEVARSFSEITGKISANTNDPSFYIYVACALAASSICALSCLRFGRN